MITITDRAKQELKALMVENGVSLEEGLRLLPNDSGQFVLGIGTEMSADQVVEYDGYKVLLIGVEYLKMLDGKIVDCRETDEGNQLFMR